MDNNVISGEILGSRRISLQELNQTAISKLHELVTCLDAKSEPDMIRSCVESLAKLNSSLKGSDILPQEESEQERQDRLNKEAIQEAIKL